MQCLASFPEAPKIHQLPCACSNVVVVVVVVNAADPRRPRVLYPVWCLSRPRSMYAVSSTHSNRKSRLSFPMPLVSSTGLALAAALCARTWSYQPSGG